MKHIPVLFLLMLAGQSCKTAMQLKTVDKLDLTRYQGTWYEIARLPNSFERNLVSVTATYTKKQNGKISVLNQGFKAGSKRKSIKGTAWVPKPAYPGRLKVRFFWPFSGDYYVIAIDRDYKYALVGSPERKFLWLLSKEPAMPDEVYKEYLTIADRERFDTSELIKVDQSLNINTRIN